MVPFSRIFRRCSQSVCELLLPPVCVVCNRAVSQDLTHLCQGCRGQLAPRDLFPCKKCGAWIGFELMTSESCPTCAHISLPWKEMLSLANYRDSMRDVVLQMKRPGQEAIGIQIGHWLGENLLGKEWFGRLDLMTPLPIHWSRKLQRGIHVTELLAEGVRRQTRLALISDLLRYRRPTRKQGKLSTRQRFENVRNCFAVVDSRLVEDKNILVIDDVMTSCATATQAAQTLLRAGARQVSLAIVARGVGQR